MGDNPTQQTPDSRSFEERVFARFDALDARMDRFESRIEGKIDALDGRLTALVDKVDSRLRETRPIWEAVLARLEAVENRLNEIEEEVKKLSRTVLLVHEDNLHRRGTLRGLLEWAEKLDGRVEKLESQSTR
jgi:DNA repair exonuclease SbcCD ATPase subunit